MILFTYLKTEIKDKFVAHFIEDASHFISQIEYGSNIKIEMTFDDKKSKTKENIYGHPEFNANVLAGLLGGGTDIEFNSTEAKNDFISRIQFQIHGTLKKTVFATNFDELCTLVQDIRADPDSFMSETPQEIYICLFLIKPQFQYYFMNHN